MGLLAALLHPFEKDLAAVEVTNWSQPNRSASTRRILICAPSNAAIDEIILRICSQGIAIGNSINEEGKVATKRQHISVVRLGDSPAVKQNTNNGVDDVIQSTSLEEQVEKEIRKEALYIQLINTRVAIAATEQELNGLLSKRRDQSSVTKEQSVNMPISLQNGDYGDGSKGKGKTSVQSCKESLAELRSIRHRTESALDRRRYEVRHAILLNADVICATLSSSNKQHILDHVLKEKILFNTVIIDEAAQTTEISTLIPLRLGCKHLVLIGT
jgi:senataxin